MLFSVKSRRMPKLLMMCNNVTGWVVGNHDIEETNNRLVANNVDALVISVDYRM